MTCAESEILMHALLDSELDAGHAREVEAHLETCTRCAAHLQAYRGLQHAMSSAQLRFAAPERLRRRVEAALPSPPPIRLHAAGRRGVLKGFMMGPHSRPPWRRAWSSRSLARTGTSACSAT